MAIMLLTVPIFFPIAQQLGFDPVWFGVYVVVLSEIACVTPPVGLNCFVVKGASDGTVTLSEIFRGLVPFLFACAAMLALLLAFPGMVTVLSDRM
jgi:TRAP-type mannitol/chloroaromatic compound transport system permease large subunit